MRWFKGNLTILGLVATVATGACYITESDPSWVQVEMSPCTANATNACSRYYSCPQGITCKNTGFAYTGWTICFHTTLSVPARIFTGGATTTGSFPCCVGGMDIGPSSFTNCTIPWETVGGSKCWSPWSGS